MNTDGYVTEVSYPVRYHRELNPGLQRIALLSMGLRAPEPGGLTYLELGCGQGFSLLAYAAANPLATFIGVDFNPRHIAGARAIATAAGLTNITLMARSFADMAAGQLPPCDVVALHGVWSWISAENRTVLGRLIAACLKPGGVLYVSYNALPAMASLSPLRELLYGALSQNSGPLGARIARSVDFAEKVRAAGARFFALQPEAAKRLDEIKSAPRDYLAHEYLNADWTSFYHRDVATTLAPLGLTYACSATLKENFEHLMFSPAALAVLAETANVSEGETLKDYFINRAFRTDLYVRDGASWTGADALKALCRTRLALCITPASFKGLKLETPLGSITPTAGIYQVLVDVLGAAPATLNELAALDAVRLALGGEILSDAVLILLAMGVVEPALPAAGEAERQASTTRLNGVLLQRAVDGEALPALVSPVTGAGLGLTHIEQVFLAGRNHGRDPVDFAGAWLRTGGHSLNRNGVALHGDVAIRGELSAQYAACAGELLPILRYLKIAP